MIRAKKKRIIHPTYFKMNYLLHEYKFKFPPKVFLNLYFMYMGIMVFEMAHIGP